ncbi:hypothetical protein QV08_03435 [Gallibacterium salpingitidis]|uniref:Malonyl-[acyl-carrier protein] O-methyltransferase n=1 Tax=Gallibacterium salpingitidis TaxID=505341 RepID=A0A1A7P0J7_9PAST|nr:malonyl-ACP O-methyltransferase BioC [Gallibacterium salpingitidis]OBW95271.1 hypothetical protein QS62_03890 [Gallibacterium salpingitidis]OBX08765.1 hypothetical protein QV08_03435 [Gallibacterium salpingitidis]WKT00438.1 malonyl-ACP O-methyltransferase BioC [Gallibacterium salpingitidis]
MALINKNQIKNRFAAAQASYPQNALAQQQINQHLIQLLAKTERRHFQQILEIGCGTGDFTARLLDYATVERFYLNDLYQSESITDLLRKQAHWQFIEGDIEQLPLSEKFDLIASASTVQWLEDKPQFLQRCATQLKAYGTLLFNSFAPDNLSEIRELTGIGLVYPQVEQWQQWLKSSFTIQHLSVETIQLSFPSPLAVLQHLRNTGVTATQKQFWTKQKLQRFVAEYQDRFSNKNGQVSLTYCPLYVVAVK